MARYVFNEVALNANKSGKCLCGKRRQRSQKFFQTINPYNKNSDGSIKDAQQITQELREEIAIWKLEPITCDGCRVKLPVRGKV